MSDVGQKDLSMRLESEGIPRGIRKTVPRSGILLAPFLDKLYGFGNEKYGKRELIEEGTRMHTVLSSHVEAVAAFKSLVEKFSTLASREGISVSPYGSQGPIHFSQLSPDQQQSALSHFMPYVSACEQVVKNGNSLHDDTHLLWRMFNELGVHPARDLMTSLSKNDAIEIYNEDFIQVFRNIRFFAVCSYSLDDLLCRPFWELFRREEGVTEKLLGVAQKILADEIKGVYKWDTPSYTVDEIASSARYHAVVQNKMISPLHSSHSGVTAFVHSFEVLSCERTAP